MERKKVLIITYYWPPSSGAGVQRWLKMTKYLPESGWDPVIYTPENPEAPVLDDSLARDVPKETLVLKRKIREPYKLYKIFIGLRKDSGINAGFLSEKQKPRIREKLSVWFRGNFFIPDARKFWINPSVRFLLRHLKNHPVHAIVSTGPPHSMHIIALKLREKLHIPWLADFRDPWTNIDFYTALKLSKRADRKHHRLEQKVLNKADKIVTIGWTLAEELTKLGAEHVDVITNGFDPDDFARVQKNKDPAFVLTHIGALNKDRNPVTLWKVLSDLSKSNEEFRAHVLLRLIGKNDYSVLNSIKEFNLTDMVECIDHLDHRDVIRYLYRSSVQLLAVNKTPNMNVIIPGKLFEYLASSRPIISIGPTDGDAAKVISKYGAGGTTAFNDETGLRALLLKYYEQYRSGKDETPSLPIQQFSRKTLADEMAGLLDKLHESFRDGLNSPYNK